MSILFECEHDGERLVGFGRPARGEPQELYRLPDGGLAAILSETADLSGVCAAVADAGELVALGDATPRFLPPLLPRADGASLVSGFMRSHMSKMAGETAPRDETNRYPQWFFKGLGEWLRVGDESMTVPSEPVALIEELEIVLVYVNDAKGEPHYAGYTFGNDLCDIGLHRRNPIYNSYCKLCDTSVTPWLFLEEPPRVVSGRTTIERDGTVAWQGTFECGLDSLSYTVDTMSEYVLEFPALRRPGMVNYIFLGADEASFHDGFRIADGDRVGFEVTTHDVSLANTIHFNRARAYSTA